MSKVYARQIAPEHQESPLFMGDEFWPDEVIIAGNPRFNSHTIPTYDNIISCFDLMAATWEEGCAYYEYTPSGYKRHTRKPEYSLAEILRDYHFYRADGKPWSNKQKYEWRLLMEGEKPGDDNDVICAALKLITGKTWSCTTIRGCCKNDWQEIIYPEEMGQQWLEIFEMEYFNTGTEWMIHDEEDAPEGPDEISGYSVYCHGWSDEEIRAEIAEAAGVTPEEIVLYKFTGWARFAVYEVA